MGLAELTELSHRYGAPEYVLVGGGNTSYKEGGVLYVKGSGTALFDVTPEQFVRMDLAKLAAMLEKEYPDDDAKREAAALGDMMAARLCGEEHKRPSVEAPLHGIFPYAYVVHTHPALINGLTCGRGGEAACRELFGEDAVWVPLTKPGYTLAKLCHDKFREAAKKTGVFPKTALLQNHGIFIAANTPDEIGALTDRATAALNERLLRKPDRSGVDFDVGLACNIAPALRMLYSSAGKSAAVFTANKLTDGFVKDRASMEPVMKPFSPDHIVYCKDVPLFITPDSDIKKEFFNYAETNGYPPKIVAVGGLGFFALGGTAKEAHTARLLFLDAMEVAVYAESFGGYLPMTDTITKFILNWETESYRQKVAAPRALPRRFDGKITLITGAAQGVGRELARAAASEGAYVVAADMNSEGAASCADELNDRYGPYAAVAARADVTDERSVADMAASAVLAYGGLDVLISNAGVLVAGGLDEAEGGVTLKDFEFVTKVNYTGYYLCVKHASAVMKIQRRYSTSYTADIIEINSKSGLVGSNKNFAYAGGKFGGIGLTQSFALELVEHGIKVNAVCPGNIFDGPLWSDPERGLFKQYLDAGKVPGAETVADVRAFYEAKVPMKRGCRAEDVCRAVFYCVEQQYETGQAIPVTGGQIMK